MVPILIAAGLLALGGAVPAMAQDNAAPAKPVSAKDAPGTPATIPFLRFDAIRNFVADDDRGIWLEDQRRNWYYADLMGPCTNLPFATRIATVSKFDDTLDSFDSFLVDGQRCQIAELTHSAGPPAKIKKAKKAKKAK